MEQAKTGFEESVKNNYKPAASSFYLGQIAYRQKKYDEAVRYYKQSAGLYDRADYMPELLLNLARSLDKAGDKKNSTIFLKSLMESYPDSKEAGEARKILNKG